MIARRWGWLCPNFMAVCQMRPRIVLNSSEISGMLAKMAPQLVVCVSPGLQA